VRIDGQITDVRGGEEAKITDTSRRRTSAQVQGGDDGQAQHNPHPHRAGTRGADAYDDADARGMRTDTIGASCNIHRFGWKRRLSLAALPVE
jgi:hypothetical protein